MVENWHKRDSRSLGDYRIFKLRQDTSRSPRTGHDHTFFVLEAGDWINVIPLTDAGEVVLIYQYRHGTETVTLEIPGGMVDPEDASAAVAAEREMREETGYAANEFIHIGSVDPNPAFLDNQCHTFLALGAWRAGPPQFDGAEDIRVATFPLTVIPDLITSGRISHALVVAAFYHLDRFRQQKTIPRI